ncbi:MAG: Hsp33 family molecular chaperone HslO [Comamonadaceae bacterium]|nr:Hsp33 family molecular chaperone HslO [Comamonadaceae bacterium]
MLVRLTDGWQRGAARAAPGRGGAFPRRRCARCWARWRAAGVLMQANIKFNGALVLQVFGDGPVKLAVAEVQPDLALSRHRQGGRRRCRPDAQPGGDAQRARPGPLRDHARPAGPPARPAALPGRGAAARRPARAAAAACRRCWSTTCCSPSSSTRGWCWPPTTRSPPGC